MTGVDWFLKSLFLSAWIFFNSFPSPVGFILRFSVRAGIKFYSLVILDSKSLKVKMEMCSLLKKINFLLLLHLSLHPLHHLRLIPPFLFDRCTPVLSQHTLSWCGLWGGDLEFALTLTERDGSPGGRTEFRKTSKSSSSTFWYFGRRQCRPLQLRHEITLQ